jgi:hypothetical protein
LYKDYYILKIDLDFVKESGAHTLLFTHHLYIYIYRERKVMSQYRTIGPNAQYRPTYAILNKPSPNCTTQQNKKTITKGIKETENIDKRNTLHIS